MSEEGAMLTQQEYARLRSIGQFDTLEAEYFALRARLEAVNASGVKAELEWDVERNELKQQLAAAEGRVAGLDNDVRVLWLRIEELRSERDPLTTRLAQVEPVCTEILRIMKVYHEQAASPNGVDTPDGLEHMGDVWNLFHKWEHALTTAAAQEGR